MEWERSLFGLFARVLFLEFWGRNNLPLCKPPRVIPDRCGTDPSFALKQGRCVKIAISDLVLGEVNMPRLGVLFRQLLVYCDTKCLLLAWAIALDNCHNLYQRGRCCWCLPRFLIYNNTDTRSLCQHIRRQRFLWRFQQKRSFRWSGNDRFLVY